MSSSKDSLKSDPIATKQLQQAQKRYLLAYQKIHYTHFSSTQLNQVFRLGSFDKWGDPVFFVFGVNHHYKSNQMERFYLLMIRWFEQQFRSLTRDQNKSVKFTIVYFNNQCNSYLQYFAFRGIYRSLPRKYLENLKRIIVVNPGMAVKALEWVVLGTIHNYIRSLTVYVNTIEQLEKHGILLTKQSINIIPESMRISDEKTGHEWNPICKSMYHDSMMDPRRKPRIFGKEQPQSDKNIKFQHDKVRIKPIELMKKKLSDYQLSDIEVPLILKLLISYLQMRPDTLIQQGIFRRSVSIDDQQQAIQQIYKRNYDFLEQISNAHIVANLIKKFLVNLHQPIIIYPIYNKFIYNVSESNVDLKYIKTIIHQLPRLNYITLQYVLSFFKDHVIPKSNLNKMTVYNISVVLCPCLFRSETISMNDLVYGKKLVTILEAVIGNFDFIFGSKGEQEQLFRKSSRFVQEQFERNLVSEEEKKEKKVMTGNKIERENLNLKKEQSPEKQFVLDLSRGKSQKVSSLKPQDSLCLTESVRDSEIDFNFKGV